MRGVHFCLCVSQTPFLENTRCCCVIVPRWMPTHCSNSPLFKSSVVRLARLRHFANFKVEQLLLTDSSWLEAQCAIPLDRAEEMKFLVCADLAQPERGIEHVRRGMRCFALGAEGSVGGEASFYTHEVCELVGASGSGKTQLCHALAARAAAHGVLYIDTSNSFSPERLYQLATGHSHAHAHAHAHDPHASDTESTLAVLGGVRCARVFDALSLLAMLHGVRDQLARGASLACVIIDSFGSLISAVIGSKDKFHGHSIMQQLAHLLKAIAWQHAVAVVLTNTTRNLAQPQQQQAVSAALGPTWRHQAHVRIALQRDGHATTATVELSPRPPHQFAFTVEAHAIRIQ